MKGIIINENFGSINGMASGSKFQNIFRKVKSSRKTEWIVHNSTT